MRSSDPEETASEIGKRLFNRFYIPRLSDSLLIASYLDADIFFRIQNGGANINPCPMS